MVIQKGGYWLVVSHTGKILGRHDTAKEAYAQHSAVLHSEGRTEAHPSGTKEQYARAKRRVEAMSMAQVKKHTPSGGK
jgi:hypothetical protein